MNRRLKIALAIGLLVFALGMCGGAHTDQSSPKQGLRSTTIFLTGTSSYDLYQFLFSSHH